MAFFWLTALGVFLTDRAVKLLALAGLTMGSWHTVWPGVLELRMSRNEGMAFGLLAGNMVANIALPVLVVVAGWLLVRRYRSTGFTRVAFAFVAGGFVGNLFDRLTIGFVLDMIYFPWMPWYICNVADIAITVGAVLMAVSLLFRPGDWELKTEAMPHETHHSDR